MSRQASRKVEPFCPQAPCSRDDNRADRYIMKVKAFDARDQVLVHTLFTPFARQQHRGRL